MSHTEDPSQGPSDFALLEGLYQLAVTGHTKGWEFERLNNAVYERLLSSYAGEPPAFDHSKRRFTRP